MAPLAPMAPSRWRCNDDFLHTALSASTLATTEPIWSWPDAGTAPEKVSPGSQSLIQTLVGTHTDLCLDVVMACNLYPLSKT